MTRQLSPMEATQALEHESKENMEAQRIRQQAIATVQQSIGRTQSDFSDRDWALVAAHEKRLKPQGVKPKGSLRLHDPSNRQFDEEK